MTSEMILVRPAEPRVISLIPKAPQGRRLKAEWVPTPLVEVRARPEILLVVPSSVDTKKRTRDVFRRLGGFALWFSKARKKPGFDAAGAGVYLNTILEDMGGIWVKVGQLLSLRNDAFPPEFCDELSKLLHRAIGFPAEIARALIEQELGKPIDEIFESFEDKPIAAASISQVHRGTLHDGSEVAVKVQRPDIDNFFHADMQVLHRLVRWLKSLNIMVQMRWNDALIELNYMMREEVDFRYEADNCRRLRRSLKEHGVYVPYVHQTLSTRRVLVMEFLHGVLMSDFIEARKQSPELVNSWLYENNIDPKKVGRRLYSTAMRQLLEDNQFHADLHPGNIMLLRDSRLALIDLGTIGELDYEFLNIYKLSLKAMAALDWGQAVDLNLRLCPEIPSIDLDALRRDLITIYRNWVSRARLKTMPYKEKSLGAVGAEAGRVMYAHKVPPSWAFLRVSRTWTTLDASLKELIDNVSYVDLFERYFKAARKRENDPEKMPDRIAQSMSAINDSLTLVSVLQAPLTRRQALAFSAGASKSHRFAASLFGLISTVLFLVGLAAALSAGARQFAKLDAALSHVPFLYDLIHHLPEFSPSEWTGIMLTAFVLSGWSRSMKVIFEAIELHK